MQHIQHIHSAFDYVFLFKSHRFKNARPPSPPRPLTLSNSPVPVRGANSAGKKRERMADQADEVVLAEYNGGRMVLVAVLFLVLTLISVALRGYVRIFIIKSFRLDDHLMMAGLVVYILLCSFILSGCLVGLGRHNRALPQSREIEALKVRWAQSEH